MSADLWPDPEALAELADCMPEVLFFLQNGIQLIKLETIAQEELGSECAILLKGQTTHNGHGSEFLTQLVKRKASGIQVFAIAIQSLHPRAKAGERLTILEDRREELLISKELQRITHG